MCVLEDVALLFDYLEITQESVESWLSNFAPQLKDIMEGKVCFTFDCCVICFSLSSNSQTYSKRHELYCKGGNKERGTLAMIVMFAEILLGNNIYTTANLRYMLGTLLSREQKRFFQEWLVSQYCDRGMNVCYNYAILYESHNSVWTITIDVWIHHGCSGF